MTKPIVSYYGGKQRIASKIVEEIHKIKHSVYAEPFAGGLAVLYAKGKYDRGNKDYYHEAINDLNECLVTMYRVARQQPEEFARIIQLTPYSQEEFRKAKEIYFNSCGYSDLDIAWATYIQCNMSFANKIGAGWGTSVIRSQVSTWLSRQNNLSESLDRLKAVHIGCEDALDFIDRWDSPHTLFYCDPPYPETDQGHYKGYSMSDFENLCNKLDTIQGSYVLSNYPQPVSPKSAQKIVEIDAVMSASKNKEADNKRTEVLWICDRSKAMREDIAKICVDKKVNSSQLSLF